MRLPTTLIPAQNGTRRLPKVSWWYSSILAVALIALGVTVAVQRSNGTPGTITLSVVDELGQPVAGAEIAVGTTVVMTDQAGAATLRAPNDARSMTISRSGYGEVGGVLDGANGGRQRVTLQPAAPPPAAPNEVAMAAGTPAATPAHAATPAPKATSSPATGTPAATKTAAKPIEGTITDAAGKPIRGARVVAGTQVKITGKDGLFSFKSDTANVAAVDVFASGYGETTAKIEGAAPLSVALKLEPIKAVYLNPTISNTQADIDRLVKMIDATELNAVVIDIKEEAVYYDTNVALFKKSGTVTPILDLSKLLKQMKEHHIYTIARLVVFKDSVLAENRKDLAILDNTTGDVWRDMNGVAWVNPADHSLWEANSDLAVEAIQHGFDEVQYDYVRFPTDGDLSRVDLGMPNDEAHRVKAITGFLKMTDEKLWPLGGKLSADVFGYTVLTNDDIGIGQNFAELAPYVDYLSPMIYPSHFDTGNMGLNGEPNDYPYETVEITMTAGKRLLDGDALKMRPWLQDFSFFNMTPYGDKQVRAQIDAAEDVGTSGWMLWDPNNKYHDGALQQAERASAPSVEPGKLAVIRQSAGATRR